MANISVVALIATSNRWDLLTGVSLQSVKQQTLRPDWVVVVNDGDPFNSDQEEYIRELLSDDTVIIMNNRRVHGAAGAWNTGLQKINCIAPEAYVAILDDDDSWDQDHLKINSEVAMRESADIVVSWLRLIIDGRDQRRPLVSELNDRTFLVGNPGWQGSNTFVSMEVMRRVGGFRDGLQSMNDRDLAIRLLRLEGVRVSYTGLWTSSWYIRSAVESLSSRGAEAKRSGIRWFWRLYGQDMSAEEVSAFFDLSLQRFGIDRDDIMDPGTDVPSHRLPKGDLNGD